MTEKHFTLYHAISILKGEKAKQQNQREYNKKSTSRCKQLIFILSGIVIFAGIFLFYTLYLHAENSVAVYEDYFQIKGAYGVIVDFAEVSDVILIEKSMDEIGIPASTNRVLTREILKGRFTSELHENILLFVRRQVEPTIHIIRENDGGIFLSFAAAEKTNALYLELLEKL